MSCSGITSVSLREPFIRRRVDLVGGGRPRTRDLPVVTTSVDSPTLYSFNEFDELVTSTRIIISAQLRIKVLTSVLNGPACLGANDCRGVENVCRCSLVKGSGIHLVSSLSVGS